VKISYLNTDMCKLYNRKVNDTPLPKLVIYYFDTVQVSMGKDGHIFLCCTTSYQRPNHFITRQESKARLSIPPLTQKYETHADFDWTVRQNA